MVRAIDMPPLLTANGSTPLGEALRLADTELKARRRLYKQKGIASYKPWIVLMTDGCPNDDYENAAVSMKRLGEEGGCFCVFEPDKGEFDNQTTFLRHGDEVKKTYHACMIPSCAEPCSHRGIMAHSSVYAFLRKRKQENGGYTAKHAGYFGRGQFFFEEDDTQGKSTEKTHLRNR